MGEGQGDRERLAVSTTDGDLTNRTITEGRKSSSIIAGERPIDKSPRKVGGISTITVEEARAGSTTTGENSMGTRCSMNTGKTENRVIRVRIGAER